MNAHWLGALVGLAFAVLDVIFLRLLASRVELADTKTVLRVTGISQIVLLPIIGWFVGPLLLGE